MAKSVAKPGELITDRYMVVKSLGAGGMGEVYLVQDTLLSRENEPVQVALKVVRPELAESKEFCEQFVREIYHTRAVTHPGVVRTFEVGTYGRNLYVTMEYVAGQPLSERLKVSAIKPDLASLILKQLCEGVQAVHFAGVIHHDIKPANILITPNGEVKLADFGIARNLTRDKGSDSSIIGSAGYLAPELWEGKAATSASDIYALGVVAYEMVTGLNPFLAPALPEMIYKHLELIPLPPIELTEEVPGWFNGLIMEMLSKEVARRPNLIRCLKVLTENLEDGGAPIAISDLSPSASVHAAPSDDVMSNARRVGPMTPLAGLASDPALAAALLSDPARPKASLGERLKAFFSGLVFTIVALGLVGCAGVYLSSYSLSLTKHIAELKSDGAVTRATVSAFLVLSLFGCAGSLFLAPLAWRARGFKIAVMELLASSVTFALLATIWLRVTLFEVPLTSTSFFKQRDALWAAICNTVGYEELYNTALLLPTLKSGGAVSLLEVRALLGLFAVWILWLARCAGSQGYRSLRWGQTILLALVLLVPVLSRAFLGLSIPFVPTISAWILVYALVLYFNRGMVRARKR